MIDPPLDSDEPSVLADWLELNTIFSKECVGHLDLVLGAVDIAEDIEIEDIAAYDTSRDAQAEAITEEIISRRNSLGSNAYPFKMSSNGEFLCVECNRTYGQSTYLACLIISQSWKSGKLVAPTRLNNSELRQARVDFEILTAVAAVGFATGPSFLLATNRQNAHSLLARIAHICNTVGEGQARNELHSAAPPAANDDGVDVIAVHQEVNGPPHRAFWFCQSASGENYKDKSIMNVIDGFLGIWFDQRPLRVDGALFFPAIVDQNYATYKSPRLGHLCHRLRMPRYAQLGFEMISKNSELIHYVDDIHLPMRWLNECLRRMSSELQS